MLIQECAHAKIYSQSKMANDNDIIKLHFIKQKNFPFTIELDRLVILQSDIDFIRGYWVCKVNNLKKTQDVTNFTPIQLANFTSKIKDGSEVSVKLVQQNFDFAYHSFKGGVSIFFTISFTLLCNRGYTMSTM